MIKEDDPRNEARLSYLGAKWLRPSINRFLLLFPYLLKAHAGCYGNQ